MKKVPKRRIVILSLIGLLVAASIAVFLLLTARAPIFTAYEPTSLPKGLEITNRSATYDATKTAWDIKPFYTVVFSTNKDVSIGQQVKTDEHLMTTCERGTENQTCKTFTTPKGAMYEVSTSYGEDEKPFYCVVTAYKNGVRIFINVGGNDLSYCDADWSGTFDSLQPYDASGLPVETVQKNRV